MILQVAKRIANIRLTNKAAQDLAVVYPCYAKLEFDIKGN